LDGILGISNHAQERKASASADSAVQSGGNVLKKTDLLLLVSVNNHEPASRETILGRGKMRSKK